MNFHAASEEWAYSKVRKRLLVEPFIESGEHGLVDYKFHTFNGRVFAIQVDLDRYSSHRRTIRDSNWDEMPVEYTYPRPSFEVSRPDNLDKMLRYAEQIGEGFSYVRVDLYEIAGCVKFGEMTFYPGAGLERLSTEFDELLGAQWSMPEKN